LSLGLGRVEVNRVPTDTVVDVGGVAVYEGIVQDEVQALKSALAGNRHLRKGHRQLSRKLLANFSQTPREFRQKNTKNVMRNSTEPTRANA
jgi:hypothetical protein